MRVRKRKSEGRVQELKEARRELKAILEEFASKHPYPWENVREGSPRYDLVVRVLATALVEYPRHTNLCCCCVVAIAQRFDEVATTYLTTMIEELKYHIRRAKTGGDLRKISIIDDEEQANKVF